MNKKKYILIFIILLTIGFASVTTLLVINGNTRISVNESDFVLYYSDAYINGIEDKSIIKDPRNIEFSAEFSKVKQEYVIDYEITNGSKNYDAQLEMVCTSGNEYLDVKNDLDVDTILVSQDKRIGTLTIKQIKSSIQDSLNFTIKCTINANAIERTSLGEEVIPENESSTYSMYGDLVDKEGNTLENKSLVLFSDPIYNTTDETGHFYINEIPKGIHTLYVIDNKSIEELKGLSEEKIKELAESSVEVTTSSGHLEFKNGYKVNNFNVHRTIKVDIGLDLNDGSEANVLIKEVGMKYPKLDELTKAGYNFLGWYTDNNTKIENNETIKIKEDHTITAEYEPLKYNISFDANGGVISTSDKIVTYDNKYGELPTPTKEGYTFSKWVDEFDNEITKDTIVKEADNHTITAKWLKNPTVTMTTEADSVIGQIVTATLLSNLDGTSPTQNYSVTAKMSSSTTIALLKEGKYRITLSSSDGLANFSNDITVKYDNSYNIDKYVVKKYLFNNGDITSNSGGWGVMWEAAGGTPGQATTGGSVGTTLYLNGGTNTKKDMYAKNTIDFTGWKRLIVNCTYYNNFNNGWAAVHFYTPGGYWNSSQSMALPNGVGMSKGIVTVDLTPSVLQRQVRLAFLAARTEWHISQVWLEK